MRKLQNSQKNIRRFKKLRKNLGIFKRFAYSRFTYANSCRKVFFLQETSQSRGDVVYENNRSCSVSAANLLSSYAADSIRFLSSIC